MTINKNGIPVNKWEPVSPTEKDIIYEFSLPPGSIRKFTLDSLINAFAIIRSYQKDYLYISGNPTIVHKQLHQILGKRLRYNCTVIQANVETKTANF